MKWVILAELQRITTLCNSSSSLLVHEILQPLLSVSNQSALDNSLRDEMHESAAPALEY